MSAFTTSWLDLREAVDAAARPPALLEKLAAKLAARPAGRLVDLATGTGANIRVLAPWLGPEQHWLGIDHDAALLEAMTPRVEHWSATRGGAAHAAGAGIDVRLPFGRLRIDVARIDLARGLDDLDVADCTLVTASALLDLVSHDWLNRLVERCRDLHAVLHLALNYDGTVELEPALVDDAWIVTALNQHQRRDKGFGEALGPAAASAAIRALERAGWHVETGRSDWYLAAGDADLQTALFEGCARAARELHPQQIERIAAWLERRLRIVAATGSRARVGHLDIVAW